jgi:DNA repair protein RecN (Recombination protein N)
VLAELIVRDLGIIQDVDWKLNEGLNVITGETGAGKSLIIDAVELLLNGTAPDDVIRFGTFKALIEGVFTFDSTRSAFLTSYLGDQGISLEDDTLIINCEIRKNKTSLVRMNGRSVTRTILRKTGQSLIDIHGQSEHLSLLNPGNHLELLDSFAQLKEERAAFALSVARLKQIESEIICLTKKSQDVERQKDLLAYQIDEIKNADLSPGEDETLENERNLFAHSEKLKEYTAAVNESISGGDLSHDPSSALSRLSEALTNMRKLAGLDISLAPYVNTLEKSLYDLEEIARESRSYEEKLQVDPRRFEELEARLELIRKLKRKYGGTLPEVQQYREKCERELADLNFSSKTRVQLEKQSIDLRCELGCAAWRLSQARQKAAGELEARVRRELHDLEMGQMTFSISLTRCEDSRGIDDGSGRLFTFAEDGIDRVEFMAATNPGEPVLPLAKIASTGEISRFTLALKGALAEADDIPVLIFDEIDIGVGGRSGDVLGRKLWNLSRHHQVVCVTHLPQIAAYADAHYCVRKVTSEGRTTSLLENLGDRSHLEEMALMLAGKDYSATALKNARELQQRAELWKQSNQNPSAETIQIPLKKPADGPKMERLL